MLLGEYEHTIDEKGRVAVPSRLRDAFRDGMVLSRGFDRCILAYPLDEWRQVATTISALPATQARNRRLSRSAFSGAYEVEIDRQGRILLPLPLREYAGIGNGVVIAGVNTHLEIWAADHWQEERRAMEAEIYYLAEAIEVRR